MREAMPGLNDLSVTRVRWHHKNTTYLTYRVHWKDWYLKEYLNKTDAEILIVILRLLISSQSEVITRDLVMKLLAESVSHE